MFAVWMSQDEIKSLRPFLKDARDKGTCSSDGNPFQRAEYAKLHFLSSWFLVWVPYCNLSSKFRVLHVLGQFVTREHILHNFI